MAMQLPCSHSVNCLKYISIHFNNNDELLNGSTLSIANKLADTIKQSTFFTSAKKG